MEIKILAKIRIFARTLERSKECLSVLLVLEHSKSFKIIFKPFFKSSLAQLKHMWSATENPIIQ